jgi:hypothetical protein
VGFGISERNAVFGALMMGLSPLFLPLEASYMTDIPGLLAQLVCAYMCQRAVAAEEDRGAVYWLVAAGVANMVLGSVRQSSWLGLFVMVPATGWYLRRRGGVLMAALVTTVVCGGGVLLFLHWVSLQPYAIVEPLRPHPRVLFANRNFLTGQLVKSFFCLCLLVMPILVAWLPGARQFSRASWLRLAAGAAVVGLFLLLMAHWGELDDWLMPWDKVLVLGLEGMIEPDPLIGEVVTLPLQVRLVLSLLVVGTTLIAVERIWQTGMRRLWEECGRERTWASMVWILNPFSVASVLLLMPRGAVYYIADKYLISLVPLATIVLLRCYQAGGARLPRISLAVGAMYAMYALGATFTRYADERALDRATAEVMRAGVSRTAISAGVPSDGWAQLELGRALNNPLLRVPPGGYNAHVPDWGLPAWCHTYAPFWYEPVIRPTYFVVFSPSACLVPSRFAEIDYRAALPPFTRKVYVEQLEPLSGGE